MEGEHAQQGLEAAVSMYRKMRSLDLAPATREMRDTAGNCLFVSVTTFYELSKRLMPVPEAGRCHKGVCYSLSTVVVSHLLPCSVMQACANTV